MILKNDISIKRTTILVFIIMYALFFLMTSINLYSYSQYEFSKTNKVIKNFNTTLSQQIYEKFNNLSDVSKYPLIIPDIDKLHSILTSNEKYEINDYNYLLYLCEMMLIQSESINGAFIYNLSGNGVFSSRNTPNSIIKNSLSETWFKTFLENDDTISFIPFIKSTDIFEYTSSNSESLIGIARKIIDLKTQEVTGVLLITIPISDLLKILTKDLPYNNQILSVFDSTGNLIVSSNYDIDFSPFFDELNTTSTEPSVKTITNIDPYFTTSNKIPLTNWILISAIPNADVYSINSLYIFSFITNIIFCSILLIVLYNLFINRIFNPINYLIDNMEKSHIEKNLTSNLTYNKNDEIGILVNSYNEMKGRINDLININYKNKIEQKDLELKQLQNQINPHFIYNTLESIHMMAELNDDEETSIMAEYFGSIIRYSMNRKINTVKLKEEINIIDNYIYLQKIRFDQLFIIENLITEDVLECEIIKMIIQPLIENAIYHGLSECSSNGKIIIQGQKIGNELLLTISDNGIGIQAEALKDLNDYINDKNNKFKGIALRNINRRLKLNYGKQYGLEIFSVFGHGTSMVLTLPYIIK